MKRRGIRKIVEFLVFFFFFNGGIFVDLFFNEVWFRGVESRFSNVFSVA